VIEIIFCFRFYFSEFWHVRKTILQDGTESFCRLSNTISLSSSYPLKIWARAPVNLLVPNINMHILHSVSLVFHMVLFGRICLNIKIFYLCC